MNKICFIKPPYDIFMEELDAPFPLMYLAAVAEQCGWEAEILDMKTLQDKIPEANVYGVTSSSPQWPVTIKLSKRLAEEFPESLTIVGGNHISAEPSTIDDTKFDLAVLGEGELPLEQILKNPNDLNGIRVIHREHIKDIDSIPFPARHLVDWSRYKRGIYWGKQLLEPAVSIISSRGCPFNCVFCIPAGYKISLKNRRQISIENMRKNDKVLSYNLNNSSIDCSRVLRTMDRDNVALYKITLENGDEIELTGEHPVYTKRGWIEAKYLNKRDELLTLNP